MLEPEHLARLTAEQKADLRLWHGRTHLLDRIKAIRGYALFTAGMWVAGFGGLAAAIEAGIPPLVFAPLVPFWMTVKLTRRAGSLRRSGVVLRRLFLPLAKWVLPAPRVPPAEQALAKLAPAGVLAGRHGSAIRRAAEDRAAVLEIVGTLAKADRRMLPDVAPTAEALVERVAAVAGAIARLEEGVDPALERDLAARLAAAEREAGSPEGAQRLALLHRQRATLDDLARRRAALEQQIESAGLALRNLRLDLVKLRSSGLQSALADVSTATQQARALSRDIGLVLDAAAEVRNL